MITLDVNDVKKRLQIKHNRHDEYIEEVIPDLIEYAEAYCNQTFEELPGPVKLFVAKAIEYNMNKAGLSSESVGGELSYSYDMDFPQSLMKLLKPYRKVRFV